jgi:hypothetical protein
MLRLLLAAALIAAPLAAATAQTTSPADADADATDRQRLALALLDASDYESQFIQSAKLMGLAAFEQGLKARLGEQADTLPDDLRGQLQSAVVEELEEMAKATAKDTRTKAANVYARYFDASELARLIELQQEPAQKKFREVGPQIVTELGIIGMEAFSSRQIEFKQRIEKIVSDWLAGQKQETRS